MSSLTDREVCEIPAYMAESTEFRQRFNQAKVLELLDGRDDAVEMAQDYRNKNAELILECEELFAENEQLAKDKASLEHDIKLYKKGLEFWKREYNALENISEQLKADNTDLKDRNEWLTKNHHILSQRIEQFKEGAGK